MKKLEGGDDLFRVRAGDYRVIYRLDDASKTVTVAVIRHRKMFIAGGERLKRR